MTVAELIEILKGMPQELPVTGWRADEEGGIGCFYERLVLTDIGVETSPDAEYLVFRERPGERWTTHRGPHVRIG